MAWGGTPWGEGPLLAPPGTAPAPANCRLGERGLHPHSGATNCPGGLRAPLWVPARPARPPRPRDRVSRSLLRDKHSRANACVRCVHTHVHNHTRVHTQPATLAPVPPACISPWPPRRPARLRRNQLSAGVLSFSGGGGNGIVPEAAPGQVLGNLGVGARRGCVRQGGGWRRTQRFCRTQKASSCTGHRVPRLWAAS